jgi:serine/threonine protein kinase
MNEREIFIAARQKQSAAEVSAFLDEACAGDAGLRQRVLTLLHEQEQLGSFLESPAVSPAVSTIDASIPERLGTVIGPYKLLEQIGEGGFGVVFMAEQQEPVRRKVALKVLKPGMDTRQVIARFEAERQALAIMDHPNIAKVFDGGMTFDRRPLAPREEPLAEREVYGGRPYFVMELVKGVPITAFCDQNHLTPRQRLELFVPVCHAVQHAHQKGIIHRDLKPSNIMVTMHDTTPVPKVIDFGVAKALGQELTDKTLFTGFAQMIGTPLYMSPEQAGASGLDIDTRSDIYSLGVLLYELLTGTTPFDKTRFKQAAHDEIRRIIREEDPPKPSTRLSELSRPHAPREAAVTRSVTPTIDSVTRSATSTISLASVSARRQMEPAKLTKLVRGELDWIVMKALEKDRNRRYETAGDFAADVQRYLGDEPVAAGPPSAGYKLRKFVRRNRGPVLAAALVVLALVGGIMGTTWGLVRAQNARADAIGEATRRGQAEDKAKQDRDKAIDAGADTEAFSTFLVDHVLSAPRPEGLQAGLGIDVTMAEALERAEPKLAAVFSGRPKAEATARHAIGVTWRNLGRYPKAEEHLRQALALRERELGPEAVPTLDTRKSLAVMLVAAGRADEAVPMLEQIAQDFAGTLGPDDPYTLNTLTSLALAYQDTGRPEKALPLMEEGLRKSKVSPGPDHPDTLTLMHNLALAYQATGREDTALTLLEEVFERQKARVGADSPEALFALSTMAGFYGSTGQLAKALALYEETLAKLKAKLGPDHPRTLHALGELGATYNQAGQADRSLPLLQQAFEKLEARLGADHPHTLKSAADLGLALANAGQTQKGLALLEQVVEKRKAKLGPDHPDTLRTTSHLADRYRVARQADRALPLLEQALTRQKVRLGPDHPDALFTARILATAYLEVGQLKKALPLFERTLEVQQVRLGPDHSQTLVTMNNLAVAYQRAGRAREALPLLERVFQKNTSILGPDHPSTLAGMSNLAGAYWSVGERDRGLALREQSVERHKSRFGPEHPLTLQDLHLLGVLHAELGKFDRALPLFEETLAKLKDQLGADHPQTLVNMTSLAAALGDAGQHAKAEPLLRELLDRRRRNDGPESPATADVLALLARHLVRQQQYAEAEPTLRECLEIREEKLPDDWRTFMTRLLLGTALLAQEKHAEAEPLLDQGYEGLRQRESQIPSLGRRLMIESLERLVRLHDAANMKEKASAWRTKLEAHEKGEEPKE